MKLPHIHIRRRASTPLPLPAEFTTLRLTAARLTADDTADIHEALTESAAELAATCDWADGAGTIKFSRRFVASLLKESVRGERLDFVVREKPGGQLVGMVMLCRNLESPTDWELGFWRRTRCRGRGFMAESAAALVALAQRSLGESKLLLTCEEHSGHVIRIAERLGFEQIGMIKNDMDERGRLRDLFVFAKRYPTLPEQL